MFFPSLTRGTSEIGDIKITFNDCSSFVFEYLRKKAAIIRENREEPQEILKVFVLIINMVLSWEGYYLPLCGIYTHIHIYLPTHYKFIFLFELRNRTLSYPLAIFDFKNKLNFRK